MIRRTLTVALLALAACGGDDDASTTTTAPVDQATCDAVEDVYSTAVEAWTIEHDGEPTEQALLDDGYLADDDMADLVDIVDGEAVLVGSCD